VTQWATTASKRGIETRVNKHGVPLENGFPFISVYPCRIPRHSPSDKVGPGCAATSAIALSIRYIATTQQEASQDTEDTMMNRHPVDTGSSGQTPWYSHDQSPERLISPVGLRTCPNDNYRLPCSTHRLGSMLFHMNRCRAQCQAFIHIVALRS
jgi:hypothetical protein